MEYQKVIVLEAVYNNSDSQSDYFDRNATLKEWAIELLPGKVVTEAKLRDAVARLPGGFPQLKWTFEKGEQYSMSDHPYGTLESEPLHALRVKATVGDSCIRLRVTMSHLSDKSIKEKGEPFNYAALKAAVDARIQRDQEWEAERKTDAYKERMRAQQIADILRSSAVIDGRGFVDLRSPEAKQAELDRVTISDKVPKWFPGKKPENWKNFTLEL